MTNAPPNADTPYIEVRDLAMAYGDFVVQHDLNFVVNKGDIFVVMGGNGCGKTTLMRALVGLQQPATRHRRLANGSSGGSASFSRAARFGVR